MQVIMVRYKVKREHVADNEAALKQVFDSLAQERPEGIRYTSCKLSDGVSFVALVQLDEGAKPLTESPSFQSFQAGLTERLDGEPPVQEHLEVVGSYRFFE